MELLLLGVLLGAVTVAVPGPISLSLVHVASQQGRSSGARAGIGVASGDLLLATLAIVLVTGGAALPASGFQILQMVSAMMLVFFGATMLLRPSLVNDKAGSIAHPFRTFLWITTLLPTALGSWLAMLAAMPFAGDWSKLAPFACGVVLFSSAWHMALGVGAGNAGEWLTPSRLVVMTRIGGIATILLGVWATA